jgi:predicted enzyme related to lactoylglutathione lyase
LIRTATSIIAALLCLLAAASAANAESIGVGPEYGTAHVYVSAKDLDGFVESFLATFGGESTKRVETTVTPTPSRTTSQLLITPVGLVSVFGFETPIPYPFGAERTGYLVTDIDKAAASTKAAGGYVVVQPFADPIGRDVIIEWPGGTMMQLYWHTKKSTNKPLKSIPENRVYVSPDAAHAFLKAFVKFSSGNVVSDDLSALGVEIGRPNDTFRRVRINSAFGKLTAFVTDGHLPFPYGRETTGYEVDDLSSTIEKAKAAGAKILIAPVAAPDRTFAFVEFKGGYIAEIHSIKKP